ncbi:cullin-1-like isoform X1 [Iris pallida]|uniref:Cullin-1-like isoform X1 n=1 Tax=Iris pallida TaxID=29817 RepID=A0AAX6I8J3_IRIPA|nr:cullin-1-like isoform X1 [Iris pallida]
MCKVQDSEQGAKQQSITPTDYFEFNSKFTDKIKRIKRYNHPVLMPSSKIGSSIRATFG